MSSPSSTDESRAEAHDDPFHLSSARRIVRPSCSLSECESNGESGALQTRQKPDAGIEGSVRGADEKHFQHLRVGLGVQAIDS